MVALLPGEVWWGGAVSDGTRMPFGAEPFQRDLAVPGASGGADANQRSPLLLSSAGRTVWSERPFGFRFAAGTLDVDGVAVELGRAGSSLAEGFRAASRRYFPPSGRTPARELFERPQLCTWIEQPFAPTQRGVLEQVRNAIDAGVTPGTIIIDDCWAVDYGTWRFDPARFPDPAAIVATLHEWGCQVMLWIVPFVSPDSMTFRLLEARGWLIRDHAGETAIRRWWNGFSALIDLSDEAAVAWLCAGLDELMATAGVDGFKFDGADVTDLRAGDLSSGMLEPIEFSQAWARIAERYPHNELRACWKMGGRPLAQRLHDKPPSWGRDGLRSLIPELVVQGLLGHSFCCPDMIGGGDITAIADAGGADQEFFVRYAQVAALCPIMQFSIAPDRVLDERHRNAVGAALRIRELLMPTLHGLIAGAAETGEPVVRHMAYHAPGMERIDDQFFLGPDLIVAPIIEQGAATRQVRRPAGRWRADDGTLVDGPTVTTVAAGLDRIPRFARADRPPNA